MIAAAGFDHHVIFGDCFDEAPLLDAARFPRVISKFASEACRNELLSAGCFHLFFPDTREKLGLLDDKRKQADARFDRHHVVDLYWSLEELLELAALRFSASQNKGRRGGPTVTSGPAPAPRDLPFFLAKVDEVAINKWMGAWFLMRVPGCGRLAAGACTPRCVPCHVVPCRQGTLLTHSGNITLERTHAPAPVAARPPVLPLHYPPPPSDHSARPRTSPTGKGNCELLATCSSAWTIFSGEWR